jgi:hypothetical protein
MGLAMEVVAGFATAPGSTVTALTMAAGSSLTIRNTRLDSRIYLVNAWADWQTAGIFQLRSPKLHDNVRGLRFRGMASEVKPLMPMRHKQLLVPQDTLVGEITGSATAGDIESAAFMVWYEDLPGAEARLISAGEVWDRGVEVATVENLLSLGTAGGFSGEEAINAEQDLLKANTDYALVGYLVDAECALVRWRGADTANLGVGGPGDELARDVTRDWFMKLAKDWDLPMVPVFNSANKGGILIDGVQDENGTDVTVTSIFVELSPGGRLR